MEYLFHSAAALSSPHIHPLLFPSLLSGRTCSAQSTCYSPTSSVTLRIRLLKLLLPTVVRLHLLGHVLSLTRLTPVTLALGRAMLAAANELVGGLRLAAAVLASAGAVLAPSAFTVMGAAVAAPKLDQPAHGFGESEVGGFASMMCGSGGSALCVRERLMVLVRSLREDGAGIYILVDR